jgi:hypothetical protein
MMAGVADRAVCGGRRRSKDSDKLGAVIEQSPPNGCPAAQLPRASVSLHGPGHRAVGPCWQSVAVRGYHPGFRTDLSRKRPSVLSPSENRGSAEHDRGPGWSRDVIWLLAAAILAQLADLVTFLRASPAIVAADETSPLPHMLGQVAGGVAAKLVLTAALVVIMVAFRSRPRTRAALLAIYTVVGVAGAAVNIAVG